MFRVNVCVCFSLTRNFVVVLCQQLEVEEKEEKERNTNEKEEEEEEDGESSSDDHIFVDNDTVYDCLLRLDISHSRHVLGKRGREKEMTQKKRERMKRREDCEKRSEIMEEAYYYREDENEKKRDYSFLFFFNMNIVYTKEEGDMNSRKQRSVCLLSDLVCERKSMK